MAPRPGRILLVVALLIALRVLGISALIPVFAPFGLTLTDSAFLVGLAFGGYGLTMALMQVPMGSLSDRFGRKPVILLGLSIYVLGNVMAGLAPNIHVLIAARIIEGIGAVASVALALLADVVPEERRTFSLAMAGIGAGVAFLVGVPLGPFLESLIGVRGIFFGSALLGVLMMVAVGIVVPEVKPTPGAARAAGFWQTLGDRRALALDLSGFVLNAALTATMFAFPLIMVAAHAPGAPLSESGYRWFLFGTVLFGGVLAVGLSRMADKRGVVRAFSVASALLIGGGAALLLSADAVWLLIVAGVAYFAGHAGQSAALPSLVGAFFPGSRRGTAMGGLNTFTYLGSFVGGIIGGLLYTRPPALPVVLLALGLLSAFAMLATRGAGDPAAEAGTAP